MNAIGWNCLSFNPKEHHGFTISAKNPTITVSFGNLSKKSNDSLEIGSINITHDTPTPNFINKIKEIFESPELSDLNNSSPVLIHPAKSHFLFKDKDKLYVHLKVLNNFLKLEKAFSILDGYLPIENELKKNIAKTYHLREYALDKSFLHDIFENLKKEIECNSIKTFLLSVKCKKLNSAPKVIQCLIISLMINAPYSSYLQENYTLASSEAKHILSLNKAKGKDKEKKKDCVLN